jgi:hypothetical protein
MTRPPIFYWDFERADVERLARAICAEMRCDPDGMVPESGHDDAALIPLWWKYQSDALKFLAMTKASGAEA